MNLPKDMEASPPILWFLNNYGISSYLWQIPPGYFLFVTSHISFDFLMFFVIPYWFLSVLHLYALHLLCCLFLVFLCFNPLFPLLSLFFASIRFNILTRLFTPSVVVFFFLFSFVPAFLFLCLYPTASFLLTRDVGVLPYYVRSESFKI